VLRVVAPFVFLAILGSWAAAPIPNESTVGPGSPAPATAPTKAAVDQLIPWLLDEDRQLREIPFAEVILDTTGKHVLAVDVKNETDQRVIKQMSAACDETMRRMNAADGPIHKVGRINEVSTYFEDTLRGCSTQRRD